MGTGDCGSGGAENLAWPAKAARMGPVLSPGGTVAMLGVQQWMRGLSGKLSSYLSKR